MQLSRRAFTGGALGFTLAGQLSVKALAEAPANLSAALAAIRTYAEAHRSYFGLPGLTVGLTTPGGFATVENFGFANADARTPITADTLFQVGSITKSMTAAVIHQLAAEGRIRLDTRLGDVLAEIPLPRGNAVTLQ